eukprot:CAMPEP_0183803330 /NCGR_PEP_ID=MMETSP0803_2-20130417/32754_1 /TAXON_ID=195967 /ORGANISM="Crustomastix stigmata, Strain CCMP3273" /LENGTH=161 /DNA_ID=CAMNT_0026048067 /DNA_START=10 /DNA_END=491 /DNA_ORIENTATION=+
MTVREKMITRDAPKHDVPTSLHVGGRELPLYTFGQLDGCSERALRNRALDLRQAMDGGGGMPALPREPRAVVAWVLAAQLRLCEAAGFGGLAPSDFGYGGELELPGGKAVVSPPRRDKGPEKAEAKKPGPPPLTEQQQAQRSAALAAARDAAFDNYERNQG